MGGSHRRTSQSSWRHDLTLLVLGAVLGALIPFALQLLWLEPRSDREIERARKQEAVRALALEEINRVTENIRRESDRQDAPNFHLAPVVMMLDVARRNYDVGAYADAVAVADQANKCLAFITGRIAPVVDPCDLRPGLIPSDRP